MTAVKNGGPAFPSEGEGHNDPRYHSPGMSLRDWFAGMSLEYALNRKYGNDWGQDGKDFSGLVAKTAYRIADAMLAEREKQNDQA